MRRVMPANSNASPGIQVIAGLWTSPRLQKSTRSNGACAITPRCRKNHFPENTQPLSAPMHANLCGAVEGPYSLDQCEAPRKGKQGNFVLTKTISGKTVFTKTPIGEEKTRAARESAGIRMIPNLGRSAALRLCAHPNRRMSHVLIPALQRAEVDRSQFQDAAVIPM